MELTTDQIKARIKNEFGSLSEFCRVVGRDRYELQKFFAACKKKMTPERIEELHVLNDEMLRYADSVYYIDDNLRFRLTMAIKRVGGVQLFCAENPEFKPGFVYEALNKKKKRTQKTDLLLNKLSIL